ncbi:hypothetical protein [Streptomyces sp. NPDC089795]|uniref:hypothetical protein n=1 Tax=Streptomyces sp. NPDC089795 TaxID=3155297 RepID=UPI00341F7EC1
MYHGVLSQEAAGARRVSPLAENGERRAENGEQHPTSRNRSVKAFAEAARTSRGHERSATGETVHETLADALLVRTTRPDLQAT